MNQDERWMERYNEVVSFIETNKRNPSRYDDEARGKFCNWLRHNRKLYSAGEMKEERVDMFRKLLGLCEQYKHVNQYS